MKRLLLSLLVFITFLLAIEKTYANDVVYKGLIYNVFFHPLIAYPNLAFTRTNKHLSYMNDWFVTVGEFNKIIMALYQRGYILVSPKDLFEEHKDAKGQLVITRKTLVLPEGKKPLILSLDDYNFYRTMKTYGTIHRFWVNDQGKLVTVTQHPNEPTIIRDDQEVPPLLEKFIATHPDFSFNKARGIIALTGYNGIFGYNTQEIHSNDYPSQLSEAKKVVDKLRAMGWEFATHSYYHHSIKTFTGPAFKAAEKRWFDEVGSIVGPTPYYIFPYGEPWNENAARMEYLKSEGFKYFFTVAENRTIMMPGAVVMGRFAMDGRSLRSKSSGSEVYVNRLEILDRNILPS